MNVQHLMVYYDKDAAERDGNGFCVDIDEADNADGTRNGGDDGHRFSRAQDAGNFVAASLQIEAAEQRPDEAFAPSMNGQAIYRSKQHGTIFIPIPPELAKPCGKCQCDYCKAKGPNYVSRWDTLAIPPAKDLKPGAWSHTWTVHFPQLQDASYDKEHVERV